MRKITNEEVMLLPSEGSAPLSCYAGSVAGSSTGRAQMGPSYERLAERNKRLEIQNRELQQIVRRLQRIAYVDVLTGLANRRYFERALQSEVRRACRTGCPLALLLCDVDHFKQINDTLGHRTGDFVLRTLGGVLNARSRRAGDLVARYGGEEFALLLAATSSGEAIDMAEQLRRRVEELSIQDGQHTLHASVTLSIGVTSFHSRTPCRPSRLVLAADAALYQAKEAGRNRTRYQSLETGTCGKVRVRS